VKDCEGEILAATSAVETRAFIETQDDLLTASQFMHIAAAAFEPNGEGTVVLERRDRCHCCLFRRACSCDSWFAQHSLDFTAGLFKIKDLNLALRSISVKEASRGN
jgi:hypothetical protein